MFPSTCETQREAEKNKEYLTESDNDLSKIRPSKCLCKINHFDIVCGRMRCFIRGRRSSFIRFCTFAATNSVPYENEGTTRERACSALFDDRVARFTIYYQRICFLLPNINSQWRADVGRNVEFSK